MKKISIISALILATVAIVSCSPGSGDNAMGKKVLQTTIQVDASDDLIAASDIEITYKGEGGIDVTDTISSTKWMKKIVNDSFPTEIGIVNYRFLIKQDTKYDKDRCQLDFKVKCESSKSSLFELPIVDWTENLIEIDDIASNKVVPYLELQNAKTGLFSDSKWGFLMGFHTLTMKVSINNGKFEVEDKVVNPDESNKHEPSKETER